MIRIKQILCPTDLSTEADEALRYATAIARAYQAKLILFFCKRPASTAEWVMGSRAKHLFEQALLKQLDARELGSLDWEGVVGEGENVGMEIAKEAAHRNTDIIVMRSRRRPHAAVLLGSTAETVCTTAPCPVLITHPTEREWVGLTTGEIDLRRVLVASDFSPDSEIALSLGLSLAEEYQAEVHLLHVIVEEQEVEPEIAWSEVSVESLYEDAKRQLRKAIPKEALLWCKVVTAACCGKPSEEILAYAREQEIDLICIGANGKGFTLGAVFGSTVDRVLRRAPCPVLVARPLKSATAKAA